MGKKKTNVDYLREIIEKNMPESNRDEAIEFLDAVQQELTDFYIELKESKNSASSWERQHDRLADEKNDLQNKLEDISEYFPENTVQYQILNEAFRKFVKEKGPLQAERILDELNGALYLKKVST